MNDIDAICSAETQIITRKPLPPPLPSEAMDHLVKAGRIDIRPVPLRRLNRVVYIESIEIQYGSLTAITECGQEIRETELSRQVISQVLIRAHQRTA